MKKKDGIRTISIERISEELPCKRHQWMTYEVKRFFSTRVILYCPNCGSWKKVI